jgi:outer membrane protein assembly factor BamB
MEGDVVSIETTTGSIVWEVNLQSEVIGAPHPTDDLLLVDAFATLVALDPSTGDIVWRTEPDGRLIASPEGVAGGNAVAWHGNLETGFEISGIDPSDGSVEWTDSCYRQFEVFDDFVVGFAPDPDFDWPQTVAVWDGATGVVLAEARLNANIDPFSISASESTAYVGTEDGQLAAINTDGVGTSWTAELRGTITLTTSADGAVFASASDRAADMRGAIHAVDASTGVLLWSTDLSFEARTQPLFAEGLVIVVSAEEVWGTF